MSTVDKALRIIEYLSHRDEAGISDISKRLKLAPSTAHRLVTSLAARDFIVQDTATKKYRLGMKIFQLGSNVANRFGVRSTALRTMEVLAEECGETVNLGVLVKGNVYYLEKITNNNPIRVELQVGHAVPAHCTAMGKAILAHLEPEKLDEQLSRMDLTGWTRHSITDIEALRRELALTRERGYAVEHDELIEGISCIAAPVFAAEDQVIAAISIAGTSARMTDDFLLTLVPLVKRAAGNTSREIQKAGLSSVH